VNTAQDTIDALDRQIDELTHEWMQDPDRWLATMFF
jgi:hypothetical protein